MAAIDLSLQTLVLDEAVEAHGLSSLPPELIVHCCRLGTASDYASMTSVCCAIRQALLQIDNKMWMAWAFKRFRRLKLIMAHVHARDEIDWKRVYKRQLAAEAVPPHQAARLTSTVEDFRFNVQIARGPLATEEAGKVVFEWAGTIEDIDGRAMLRLWKEEEEEPLWFREADEGWDLRLSLWVSKFEAQEPITVCLQDRGVVDEDLRDEDGQLVFEPTGAPDVLKGQVNARDDALQILHEQEIHEGSYLVHPIIFNGLMSEIVISHNDNNGLESLTTKQTLIYLQQSVPWNLRWNHKKRRFQMKPK